MPGRLGELGDALLAAVVEEWETGDINMLAAAEPPISELCRHAREAREVASYSPYAEDEGNRLLA